MYRPRSLLLTFYRLSMHCTTTDLRSPLSQKTLTTPLHLLSPHTHDQSFVQGRRDLRDTASRDHYVRWVARSDTI
ncbi:hypothetical protein BDW02DRAFT_5227 [Decorospora gaudefroyi]|uniref:Uncharacterized protein n=1 Tax=Decorospora gaudefroyi TaxID=184978 RepID=A0A6A5KTY0_9PLEO|nr:hypothetical protein BDW02DRAFT_5227 [Decorospora gaudefroyi]